MSLSPEHATEFYDLLFSLQYYVNSKLSLIQCEDRECYKGLPLESKLIVRNALYENVTFVDSFVAENPFSFSEDQLNTVRGWRLFIKGSFYVLRFLRKHSVLVQLTSNTTSTEESAKQQQEEDSDEEKEEDAESTDSKLLGPNKVFGVLGISQTLQEMFNGKFAIPIYIETVLLPFKGRIIYDGLLFPSGAAVSTNTNRYLNSIYTAARKTKQLIFSIEESSSTPSSSSEPIRVRTRLRTRSRLIIDSDTSEGSSAGSPSKRKRTITRSEDEDEENDEDEQQLPTFIDSTGNNRNNGIQTRRCRSKQSCSALNTALVSSTTAIDVVMKEEKKEKSVNTDDSVNSDEDILATPDTPGGRDLAVTQSLLELYTISSPHNSTAAQQPAQQQRLLQSAITTAATTAQSCASPRQIAPKAKNNTNNKATAADRSPRYSTQQNHRPDFLQPSPNSPVKQTSPPGTPTSSITTLRTSLPSSATVQQQQQQQQQNDTLALSSVHPATLIPPTFFPLFPTTTAAPPPLTTSVPPPSTQGVLFNGNVAENDSFVLQHHYAQLFQQLQNLPPIVRSTPNSTNNSNMSSPTTTTPTTTLK